MLSLQYIESLSVEQLKTAIRNRGGFVGQRAKNLNYLRNYLWEIRYATPNIVTVIRKRRSSKTKSVVPITTPAPVDEKIDLLAINANDNKSLLLFTNDFWN